MQLHALLSSIEKLTNLQDIKILHRYDEEYKAGLEKVIQLHPNVKFIQEFDFQNQVKQFLKEGQKFCVFFVDDMLIKRELDINVPCKILETNPNFLTFSLRMGTHLTYCYPMNSQQSVPNGVVNSGFFMWNWKGATLDWGYPFSVDAHVFRRNELEGWVSHLNFKNPNQFESNMQEIKRHFVLPNDCICYLNSVAFNMPINRVQHEFQNRTEEVSIDKLYDEWMEGNELNIDITFNLFNAAAHAPTELPFKKI